MISVSNHAKRLWGWVIGLSLCFARNILEGLILLNFALILIAASIGVEIAERQGQYDGGIHVAEWD